MAWPGLKKLRTQDWTLDMSGTYPQNVQGHLHQNDPLPSVITGHMALPLEPRRHNLKHVSQKKKKKSKISENYTCIINSEIGLKCN